ncbi:SRPBCC family protein [Brachybacterium sp. GCM10030252]|uniref:SRPBCC family protein n=1 Tax=Brachybacterium sp. GCM10030252 TaxID=3273380 RepID=UPI00361CE2E5
MNVTDRLTTAAIEADPDVPLIRITRDFPATPEQIVRAHTDPDLYAQWVGPKDLSTRIDHWDARTGGSWAFTNIRGEEEYSFHGCFHEVSENRIVQTFTFDGWPEGVSLETMRFEDLGDGWTRMHSQSLTDSFEARGQMLESGMEVGINEGYAKLDELLEAGSVPAGAQSPAAEQTA